ncbi:MAG: acyl-homoserine-lactone synthase [Pseudomonadota bacterium]
MKTMILNQKDKNFSHYEKIVNGVYELRYETFKNRLNWDIETKDGKEKDQFDDLDFWYIAITNQENRVDGCWRALPTTGNYMLESIFPELMQGEKVPKAENVWEISRFAVRKGSATEIQGYWNTLTIDLIASFYKFAQEQGIEHYVTVTTVACERILRQLNVKVRRMGEGREMKIGKERSVALWIEVNDKLNIATH